MNHKTGRRSGRTPRRNHDPDNIAAGYAGNGARVSGRNGLSVHSADGARGAGGRRRAVRICALRRPRAVRLRSGNNGGDGCAAARLWMQRGGRADVWLLKSPSQMKGDAGRERLSAQQLRRVAQRALQRSAGSAGGLRGDRRCALRHGTEPRAGRRCALTRFSG